ncbi:hypothetical protein Elgi_04380 [Paenibacillus elgii]|nr:hypothetical protein Elgi_04380 [Paenibacillus elgii]
MLKYSYDKNGKLVDVISSIDGSTFYEYDANGNMIRKDKSSNLLLNPSFDRYTGTNGIADGWEKEVWSSENSTFEVIPTNSGGKVQKISGSRIGNNGMVAVAQVLRVLPNQSFNISGRFNIEKLSNAKAQLYVDFFNDSGFTGSASVTESQALTEGEMVTLSTSGVIPRHTLYARVLVILRGMADEASGTVYVDMLNMSYESEANLLANSSFDRSTQNNGLADAWGKSMWGNPATDVGLTRLSSGARVQKVAGSGMVYNEMAGVSQLVKVDPGKPFQVSGSINIEQLTNAKVQLYVDFIGTSGFTGASVAESQAITNGGYATLSSHGIIPPNTLYARVYALIRGISDGASGTMYVDSINFNYEKEVNLLANSNFGKTTQNNGLADGWGKSMWGNPATDVELIRLSSGARIQKVTGSGIINNGMTGVSQLVKVEPGKPFQVSGRFNIEQLTNAKIQLYVDFIGASGFTGASVAESQAVTNGGYATLSSQGIIPPNTLYARVYALIRGTSDGASGTMYVESMNFNYETEANLIANSSFERSTQNNGLADGWGKSMWGNPTADYELIRLSSGARVQKVTGSGMINNGMTGVNQLVKVEPGKPFQVSGRFNIEQLTNAKIQLYVDFIGASGFTGASIAESQATTNGEYATLSSHGIIPPNTLYAQVHALIRGTSDGASGTMYVDSMNFNYETEANLIANGSFDKSTQNNGLADGWGKSMWGNPTADFELIRLSSGARVQKVTGSGMINNGMTGVSQLVKVEPGKPFQVSGRFNIEQLIHAKVQLYVDFVNATGGFTGVSVTESNTVTSGDYVTLSSHGIVPPNTTYATVYALVRGTSDGASGTMYVDMMNLRYGTEADLLTNTMF